MLSRKHFKKVDDPEADRWLADYKGFLVEAEDTQAGLLGTVYIDLADPDNFTCKHQKDWDELCKWGDKVIAEIPELELAL